MTVGKKGKPGFLEQEPEGEKGTRGCEERAQYACIEVSGGRRGDMSFPGGGNVGQGWWVGERGSGD